MFRKILLIFVILFALVFSYSSKFYIKNAPVENVFIVVIDGVRYQDGFGSMTDEIPTNNTFPKLWALTPNGTIIETMYVGHPSGYTETVSSHKSMITGVYQNREGYTNYPTSPTLFEYYRSQTKAPTESCLAIMGKSQLACVKQSTTSYNIYGIEYWNLRDNYSWPGDPAYRENFWLDNQVWASGNVLIQEKQPNICFMNFPLVDTYAHTDFLGDAYPYDDERGDPTYNVYEFYLDSIRNADNIVDDLWHNTIQSDPKYQDKTLLIVMTDHGRHNDNCGEDAVFGPQHHEGTKCISPNIVLSGELSVSPATCTGNQQLIFFAIGPGIKKGYVSDILRKEIDIVPTIGKLMGIRTPDVSGNVMTEILE